jgi:prepilin-type N-terminal cleavage/methylation domain-containing protein
MKQVSKKKGFSLIELIVVIAVIAAIAAVIVPQFSNISGAAKNSSDQRNVQLWNEVYSNVYAINGDTTYAGTYVTGNFPTAADGSQGTNCAEINYTVNVSGTAMKFYAPSFTWAGTQANTYKFSAGNGFKKNN